MLDGSAAPVTAAPECRPLQAPGDVITVCLSDGCDYDNVQDAVDAASGGEIIKVATGVYTDIRQRAGITQVVYVSKTVTIRGGYTTTNDFADPPDSEANPATLDAGGQGRAMVISSTITSTVEGLRITGGDATGLGGFLGGDDTGGGVYVYTVTATISNCVVYSNTASTADEGGGGLGLDSSDATLSGNVVQGNTASTASEGKGGGIYLSRGAATLSSTGPVGAHTLVRPVCYRKRLSQCTRGHRKSDK